MLRVYSAGLLVVATILLPVIGGGASQKTTTVITSETMTASSQKNQAIFRGNVKMVQDNLVVHSDIMTVYFEGKNTPTSPQVGQPSSPQSKKEIRFIKAEGNVKIAQGESRATCQYAVFDKLAEKVVLRGSPVAWQSGTRISGPKMTMYLKENRSVVEGGTQVTIEEMTEN